MKHKTIILKHVYSISAFYSTHTYDTTTTLIATIGPRRRP